jgi:RimJ/RimL family protein N-acetyltransferase
MEFSSTTLKGSEVTLEPIGIEHLEGLQAAACDPHIWKFIPFALDDPSMMELFVNHVTELPKKGEGQAYAIKDNASGRIIGGSGYWHIDHQHCKLEIGGSWIMGDFQRSGSNTEAKYLLLENAFETLGCKRVGFSVDVRNEKSLKAIERIGAVKEGILRSDMQMHDGTSRDSAIYSIIQSEWTLVKSNIEKLRAVHA